MRSQRINDSKKSIFIKKLITIGLVIVVVISPFFQFIKSGVVMSIYSAYENSTSILADERINIDMPGGLKTKKKDWYPFVMTFNDDYYLKKIYNRDIRLTILYNFGAFDIMKGCSTIYQEGGEYLNAFYGAYIVKDEEKPFGYNGDQSLNYDEINSVPSHDMRHLVLSSIGKEAATFETEVITHEKIDGFLGYNDWDVVEVSIKTQSMNHNYETNHMAYIQYGKPKFDVDQSFMPIQLKGKTYVKYFAEHNVTVFFYAMAQSETVINETFENIIGYTKFEID